MPEDKDDGCNDLSEYVWIDGVESLDGYQPGGYHPITIGQILCGRFYIIHKLGYGNYSTVWLARDITIEQYVALKVCTADSTDRETTSLQELSTPSGHLGRSSIPSALSTFLITGPNGTHLCYTMLPAQGDLAQALSERLLPLDVTRALVGGLVVAVAYVHSRGYVHGDIQPRNILIKLPSAIQDLSAKEFYERYGEPYTEPIQACDGKPLPPNIPKTAAMPLFWNIEDNGLMISDTQILLSDFGESFSPYSVNRIMRDCHIPAASCPPEVKFEPLATFSFSADIWSLAIAIWYIVGADALFGNEFVSEDEMVCQQVDVLGPLPKKWFKDWENGPEFFNENGLPKGGRQLWPSLEKIFEEFLQKYRRHDGVGELGEEEKVAFLELMRRMLRFEPDERPTIAEVLQSEWVTKWVMPDFERSRASSEPSRKKSVHSGGRGT